MCESNVYLKNNGKEELFMENVAAIIPVNKNSFKLKGLLGENKEIIGKIIDINLMAHKILFESV